MTDGHCVARHLSTISLEVDQFIESSNFSTGVSGWRIDGDGNIEANDGTFRGDLAVGATISAEEIQLTSPTFSRIQSDRALFLLVEDAGTDEVLSVTKTLAGDIGAVSIGGPFGDTVDIDITTDGDVRINGAAIDLTGDVSIGGGTPMSFVGLASRTWTGGSIGSHTTHTNTVAVTGALAGDHVFCSSEPTGTGANSKFLVGGRVTSAGTVTLYGNNCDGVSNSITGLITRVLVLRL